MVFQEYSENQGFFRFGEVSKYQNFEFNTFVYNYGLLIIDMKREDFFVNFMEEDFFLITD